MNKITVFIVDDEMKAIQTLSKVLAVYFEQIEVIGYATSIDEALKKIQECKPNVVFLDIEMGAENGFQLLERLDTVNFHVVFLTAYEEYALKAIKFSALDYIIKPAGISDLKALWEKVSARSNTHEENIKVKHLFDNFMLYDKNDHKLAVPTSEGYEFISIGEVMYIRADGSYTHITLVDEKVLMSSKNLKFYERLLDTYGFFRVHNSTLINVKYIKSLHKSAGGSVVMKDNQEFSISKSRKEAFMEALSLR